MNAPVAHVLDRKGYDVVTVPPTASVFDAVTLMEEKRIGCLLMLSKTGKMAGILSEKDCVRKVFLPEKNAREVLVKDIMSKKVIYVTLETTVDDCMSVMTQKRIRHLPVMDGQKVVGLISIGDLVKFVSSQQDIMIRNLEKYIEGSL